MQLQVALKFEELERFRDASIPKLDNLRRAAQAKVRVPATYWIYARSAREGRLPGPPPIPFPLIVRSGSPTEDTGETSNAGQLLSLPARTPADFEDSLRRVIEALPRGPSGEPLGAVFVQPLLSAEEAGVAFCDGFYFERTFAAGSNEALTSGRARGEVVRGHLARGDAWSAWLGEVLAVFRGERAGALKYERIDIEYARDSEGFVLLQCRPALFPVKRNETLSLANHKEILGDPPGPWIASVVASAGAEVLSFFAEVDAKVARWEEAYAVLLGERAFMNFSFFFRLMDTWGLPRSFVTQGVGGAGGGPEDDRVLFARFLRSAPRLVHLQVKSFFEVLRVRRRLRALDERIGAARSLEDLYRANVAAMGLAIRTNFAINGILSGVSRVRRALGVSASARVVTEEMMDRYGELARIEDEGERERALDAWLSVFGHRGPLESDPARPRFAELRSVLLAELKARPRGAGEGGAGRGGAGRGGAGRGGGREAGSAEQAPRKRAPSRILRPLFWIDERREWFRDELMKRWKTLRERLLEEGAILLARGELDDKADVFLLRGVDITAGRPLREAVIEARARMERAAAMALPLTASRERIEAAIAETAREEAAREGRAVFPGIALGPKVFEGRALKAADLTALLIEAGREGSGGLGPDVILIVEALEPSWAVVFPRVGGVVAEIGGELSHASILLREARLPAVVNCDGIYRATRAGDRVRIDGARGLVEILRDEGGGAAP
jgi:phosphohistidine swiveling domain-containing protein